MVEIATERLILGRIDRGDAQSLFESRTAPGVSRYPDWNVDSVDEAREYIDAQPPELSRLRQPWTSLAIRKRVSGQFVGEVGFRSHPNAPKQAEVACVIATDHQRMGFGTEALVGLINHLFAQNRLHRIFVEVEPKDRPACSLLERIGMRREAHFVKSRWAEGAWSDAYVYGVLSSEWRPSIAS